MISQRRWKSEPENLNLGGEPKEVVPDMGHLAFPVMGG
jgi:hypothetical protein